MRIRLMFLALVFSVVSACGGDSPTGPRSNPPTFENIAGTYAGVLGGLSQGVTMSGTFTLTRRDG